MDAPKERNIKIISGYGANTKRPFIELDLGEKTSRLHLSSTEARNLAINLLQACDAAESDGFIVEFFTQQIGISQREAAGLLSQFRIYRESLGGPAAPMWGLGEASDEQNTTDTPPGR